MNLVVMAAGMGSRFGGLKQLTPVGENGEFIIDYSVYDAIKAGVKKVIFIIKEEHLDLFRNTIGKRIEKVVEVEYAFQNLSDLPCCIDSDIERTKPWGTGQALLASKKYVDDLFMIINADDFYGRDAFLKLAEYLNEIKDKKDNKKHYAMVAYKLENTLSENGSVSRGECEVENDYLKKVTEHTKIEYKDGELVYFENDNYFNISPDTKVSMNLYGFSKEIFEDASSYFIDFLKKTTNLTKDEFYLPTIVCKSIEDNKADVKVLNTSSKYFGMTYPDDLDILKKELNKLILNGTYPKNLWGELE